MSESAYLEWPVFRRSVVTAFQRSLLSSQRELTDTNPRSEYCPVATARAAQTSAPPARHGSALWNGPGQPADVALCRHGNQGALMKTTS